MLTHSRRLNPGVTHHVGDMRSVRIGESFDAAIIHDAIDYMTTEDELRAVFATARAHLRAGGLLILAPDHYTETFTSPSVDDDTNSDGETTLTYVEYSFDLDPTDTTVETTYVFFIIRAGELIVEVRPPHDGAVSARDVGAAAGGSGVRVGARRLPGERGRDADVAVGVRAGEE